MNDLKEPRKPSKIPQLLLVTGILSIIGTSMTILSGIRSLIAGKPKEEDITEVKLEMARSLEEARKNNINFLEDLIKNVQIMLDAMYENFIIYTLVASLVAGVGLAGAILMIRRKEIGFHLYIIYCFLYIAQSYLFVPPSNVPLIMVLFNIFVSGIFIYIYSRNINWFRKLD
ncbi:MAG: hypothetical protein ACOVNZ_00705 [Crocinitomicaceae bacterium]|jgi:hypothetical protein